MLIPGGDTDRRLNAASQKTHLCGLSAESNRQKHQLPRQRYRLVEHTCYTVSLKMLAVFEFGRARATYKDISS
jgi:hypothetical protein